MTGNGDKYPFEEFLLDFSALTARKRDSSFEATFIEVHEYMREKYGDSEEGRWRLERFILILQYVSDRIEMFDSGDFAVYGSPKVGALISEHLLKAVHEVFTTRELSELGYGPPVNEVLRLAEKYRR